MKAGLRRFAALGAVLLLLAATACESDRTNPQVSEATPSVSKVDPGRSPEKQKKSDSRKKNQKRRHERRRTHPEKAKITNLGLTRADRKRVDKAVSDLKDLGFWRELTKHVVQVNVATRPGLERIPEDGHLADAIMNVQLEPRAGYVCEIMIFSDALANDVTDQLGFYLDGRLSTPPPTLRQFWAVILAHEVGHCSPKGQKGEAHSTEWEQKVLAAFHTTRLGTPPT